mmetsp:Transcript_9687/g.24472  ORF Transcript_9687/g.24472 Transcript_9687/m.24472 type:complete len:227 (+) Transcript_9687:2525-3205(+)
MKVCLAAEEKRRLVVELRVLLALSGAIVALVPRLVVVRLIHENKAEDAHKHLKNCARVAVPHLARFAAPRVEQAQADLTLLVKVWVHANAKRVVGNERRRGGKVLREADVEEKEAVMIRRLRRANHGNAQMSLRFLTAPYPDCVWKTVSKTRPFLPDALQYRAGWWGHTRGIRIPMVGECTHRVEAREWIRGVRCCACRVRRPCRRRRFCCITSVFCFRRCSGCCS